MAINIERLKEVIKANGFTAEMLGIAPKIETIRDEELMRQMQQFIVGMEIEGQARENFSEKYWEYLGIQKKKYKVVKVRMEKTIYKDIYVAMPEDENTDNVDNYIGSLYNLDNDCPDDEEEWDVNDYEVDEDNMTADDVNRRGQDEIWNYNDFED